MTENDTQAQTDTTTYEGTCHCGAVRFQVQADPTRAARCNCSICTRVAQLGVIVKPEAFRLLAGDDALSFYEWGHKISRRYFCRHCGVHCFGRGFLAEIGGAFVSANLNCVEALDPARIPAVYWDGRHDNWQAGPRDRPWPIHAPQP